MSNRVGLISAPCELCFVRPCVVTRVQIEGVGFCRTRCKHAASIASVSGHSPVTLVLLPTQPPIEPHRRGESPNYTPMDDEQGKFGTQSQMLSSRPLGLQLSYLSLSSIFSGHLDDPDNKVSFYRSRLQLLPRSGPLHVLGVYGLAAARFERYLLSSQQDDLEQSILGFTEAILSLPLSQDTPLPFLNINQAFHSLTVAIFLRADKSRRPEDVKYSVIYLRYRRGQQHEVYNHISFPVTSFLVEALSFHVDLELGDVDQDIDEMADLCGELLNSDISTDSLTYPIRAFAETVLSRYRETFGGGIPFEKAIGCLRKAVIRLPDLHFASIVLADSLSRRFYVTISDDDYNEGMAILDNLIRFRGPGDTPSPERENAFRLASRFSYVRAKTSGKPEDLEREIYFTRTLLDGMSLEDPHRDSVVKSYSFSRQFRLDGTGIAPNLESLMSEPGKHPSFRDLTASLPELSVRPVPETTFDKHLDKLYSIDRLTDIAEIEDGVNYCQQLVTSYPDDRLAIFAGFALGHLLLRGFQCTNEIEYLNKAISASRDHVSTGNLPFGRSIAFHVLISSLSTRLTLLKRREDSNEIIKLLAIVPSSRGVGFLRLLCFCLWASVARHFGHSSVSTAYDYAVSSLQTCLTLAPTLDTQHSQLVVTMGNTIKTLPLDYTSHQIHIGQLKQAIETLERGRSLLWSEMRGLRTPVDQIRFVDPHLADNFAAINRELEMVTLALSPKTNVHGRDSDIDAVDAFGDLVVRQRKLFDDREKLISQIQALPGFYAFLKPPSFDHLRSAARHGPVIIINHSGWRSDIIILLHNSPPSLITTPNDFYARANKLQDQLLGARKEDPESNTYEDALRSVLKELYELVGQPVIKRLNELNVPEQSRIWWCPTSVFCSLPLHAMGPIRSDVDPPQYFLDLYIPSYIPSLSVLIQSRRPATQTIGKPSILLVAHPDENMPAASKEMKAVQSVDTQVTTLFSVKATPKAMLARLKDHPFAHIVCHGILEAGKPFEASFKLHKEKHLQLLDIVRSQLPDAEFAFLSACHTAGLTKKSIADEVLHLAAAMQFCGFRSVVGTMWAMADIDGPDLARHFYQSLFSDEAQLEGRHYYERTALALRDAVLNLRRKGGITSERWVNYVHYGA
jgi:CHAT domain-containing protein